MPLAYKQRVDDSRVLGQTDKKLNNEKITTLSFDRLYKHVGLGTMQCRLLRFFVHLDEQSL